MSESSTSSSLLERVQCQDPEAWHRLVELYGPLVFYWCQRSGVSAADAADVFQEVFISVSSAIEHFEHSGPERTFRGWLWTITRNKIRDYYRRQSQQPGAIGGSSALRRMEMIPDHWDDSSGEPQDHAALQGLYVRAMELVRAEFEPRTWQAFWMSAVEGIPSGDVAQQLGITPGAVRQYKSRVLRRLRQQLGDLSE